MTDGVYEAGSQAEAAAAVIHHHHHPADPNAGVVRARLRPGALRAAFVAAAVTVIALVLLGFAIGGAR